MLPNYYSTVSSQLWVWVCGLIMIIISYIHQKTIFALAVICFNLFSSYQTVGPLPLLRNLVTSKLWYLMCRVQGGYRTELCMVVLSLSSGQFFSLFSRVKTCSLWFWDEIKVRKVYHPWFGYYCLLFKPALCLNET